MAEYKSGLDCNVLVLNKNYMAVRVIGVRRAFSMLLRKIAEVISIEDGAYYNYDFESWCEVSELHRSFAPREHDWVSAINFHIAVPRIIRLISYDRLPKRNVKFNRRNIFDRDRNKCQYCGKNFATSELSLDHVVPKSKGGKAEWINIVCACFKCNSKKGGRTPQQANMKLIKKPFKPKYSPLIHIHLGSKRYQSWRHFVNDAYWSVELK